MEGLGAIECSNRLILTDREIKISIGKGLIVLKPPPKPEAYSSTALNLTLYSKIRKYKKTWWINIDPGVKGYDYNNIRKLLTDEIKMIKSFDLKPSKLILGWTNEYLKLPVSSRLAARIEGRSSLARIGLAVHLTAPTIHAGFGGTIQMEIVNHGPATIVL